MTNLEDSSRPPCLIVRGLSNAYSSRTHGVFGKKVVTQVLDSVNLEVRQGEIFGLVGESGCGKTTLARCILGLIDYQGEILIRRGEGDLLGQVKNPSLKQRKERAHLVQAVFQDPAAALNPVKTLGWILEEPLRAQGSYSAQERKYKVDRILDLVGLNSSYKTRRPRELSSGQKQRVSIGAALMVEPALIIADEPVSALDVSVGAQILNLFRELNENLGLAFLFISHNMELVHYLCGRIAHMEGGRILSITEQP
ncbi:MAG: ATP-binding cassette domain-containing protein [Treponema sp.]|nr:ATP-binding cassette domain-containing protein [Treponema sp.]